MTIKKITLLLLLTSFIFADGYKSITRAKYNKLVQEPKVALVIGNKDYEQDSLAYPIIDAKKIRDFLEDRGFKVIYAPNVQTKGKLRRFINQFVNSIQKDGTGLFYFSGHGMSAYNKNYLIPTKNSSIADNADVEDVGLSVSYLLRKLEEKENRLNIVILDACRNTLGKGASSALTGNSAEGVFIAYATAEGKRAKDNGLFASAFVESAKIKGLSVEEVFKKVRKRVKNSTGQTPFTNSGIVGDFYFTLPDKQLKNERSRLVIPSNSICKANGGKIYKGVCKAELSDAKKICFASGTRLSSMEDLEREIKDCGGIPTSYWDGKGQENIDNTSYQSCYKQKGLSADYLYWGDSTEVMLGGMPHAWIVEFENGEKLWRHDVLSSHTICIR